MQTNYSKNPVALGVALALGMGGASTVVAQEEEDNEMIEEVVVVGIRGALMSAQSLKENADTFVDTSAASRRRQTLTASRWKVPTSLFAAFPTYALN
jgi:hypothetical protein